MCLCFLEVRLLPVPTGSWLAHLICSVITQASWCHRLSLAVFYKESQESAPQPFAPARSPAWTSSRASAHLQCLTNKLHPGKFERFDVLDCCPAGVFSVKFHLMHLTESWAPCTIESEWRYDFNGKPFATTVPMRVKNSHVWLFRCGCTFSHLVELFFSFLQEYTHPYIPVPSPTRTVAPVFDRWSFWYVIFISSVFCSTLLASFCMFLINTACGLHLVVNPLRFWRFESSIYHLICSFPSCTCFNRFNPDVCLQLQLRSLIFVI